MEKMELLLQLVNRLSSECSYSDMNYRLLISWSVKIAVGSFDSELETAMYTFCVLLLAII